MALLVFSIQCTVIFQCNTDNVVYSDFSVKNVRKMYHLVFQGLPGSAV